jgi:tRNA (uracil-5-)-methyltransferase
MRLSRVVRAASNYEPQLYVRTRRVLTVTPPAMSSPIQSPPPAKRFKPSSPLMTPLMRSPPSSDPLPLEIPLSGPSTTENPTENLFFPQTYTKSQLRRRQRSKHPLPEPYSSEDVLFRDVRDFLGPEWVDEFLEKGGEEEWVAPVGLPRKTEVTLRVGGLTVNGESPQTAA